MHVTSSRPAAPAPIGVRPVNGAYLIDGIVVETHHAGPRGSSIVRIDSFDNIRGMRPVQLADIYLRDEYTVTPTGTRTPGYNMDFRVPRGDAQRYAVRALGREVLDSGLLDLPRTPVKHHRMAGEPDADRGLVEITISGRDNTGRRIDSFATRLAHAPGPVRDVVRAVQQMGADMMRYGDPVPE